jgi:hypothetical protein
MNEKNNKSKTKANIFKILGDFCLEILNVYKATTNRLSPLLGTCFSLVLILLIIALFASILLKLWYVTLTFIILLISFFLVIVFLIIYEVARQRKQIRNIGSIKYNMTGNTLKLANQLAPVQKAQIRDSLRLAVYDAAEALEIDAKLLRSNLFGKDEQNNMRMILDFTFNMNWREEYTISMPVGYGSTGRCFTNGEPNIAILSEDWGKDSIEDEQLKKIHPDLRWIISMPVYIGDDKSHPFWVMNVDGLKVGLNESRLDVSLKQLFNWSKIISVIASKYE